MLMHSAYIYTVLSSYAHDANIDAVANDRTKSLIPATYVQASAVIGTPF